MLVSMHSSITDITRGKGNSGVFNTVSSLSCKPCHCQEHLRACELQENPISPNAQGRGDSRLSRSYSENPFNIKPWCWKSDWEVWVEFPAFNAVYSKCDSMLLWQLRVKLDLRLNILDPNTHCPENKTGDGVEFVTDPRICLFLKWVPWILFLFPCREKNKVC